MRSLIFQAFLLLFPTLLFLYGSWLDHFRRALYLHRFFLLSALHFGRVRTLFLLAVLPLADRLFNLLEERHLFRRILWLPLGLLLLLCLNLLSFLHLFHLFIVLVALNPLVKEKIPFLVEDSLFLHLSYMAIIHLHNHFSTLYQFIPTLL